MLSIIIPTLNEEKYLERTLELIKNEGFDDYEIIVADGGSKDKTKEIAQSFGCKIVEGGLPPIARNNGAKVAKGDLLFFLDADLVFVNKGTIKEGIKEFNERNLDISAYPISISGEKIDKLCYDLYNKWADFVEKIEANGSQAILVKKDFHEKLGGFNENVKISEDYEYINRGRKIGNYGRLKTDLVVFSDRRVEKEGRSCYAKYLLSGWYTKIIGPVEKDFFNYKFNHYSKENPPSLKLWRGKERKKLREFLDKFSSKI